MKPEPTELERSYARAVLVLSKILQAEAERHAVKDSRSVSDTRALADLAQALASLERGALWAARAILERKKCDG